MKKGRAVLGTELEVQTEEQEDDQGETTSSRVVSCRASLGGKGRGFSRVYCYTIIYTLFSSLSLSLSPSKPAAVFERSRIPSSSLLSSLAPRSSFKEDASRCLLSSLFQQTKNESFLPFGRAGTYLSHAWLQRDRKPPYKYSKSYLDQRFESRSVV